MLWFVSVKLFVSKMSILLADVQLFQKAIVFDNIFQYGTWLDTLFLTEDVSFNEKIGNS